MDRVCSGTLVGYIYLIRDPEEKKKAKKKSKKKAKKKTAKNNEKKINIK